jgi:hypothetical protein
MCERAAAAGEPAMSLPCYLEWLDTRFDPADAWVADYESAANELMEDAAALAALIAEDAD